MGQAGLPLAGVVGSVTTDFLKSTISGRELDKTHVAANAAINAGAALLPGAKGAATSLAMQDMKQFAKGQIKKVTAKTAAKVAAGIAKDDGGVVSVLVAGFAAGIKDQIVEQSDNKVQIVPATHPRCAGGASSCPQ
jgi:hypothetical protein